MSLFQAVFRRVERMKTGPIISKELFSDRSGDNINGPSAIQTPPWLSPKLGNFYCYFAHHDGDHIRLAFSDALDGPWKIKQGGVLNLADASGCWHHIASPDVHVDHATQKIVMFFHGPATRVRGQRTFRAVSGDGLHFAAEAVPLADPYFRTVPWQDVWLGMAFGGKFYAGRSLMGPFSPARVNLFAPSVLLGGIRHVALHVRGDVLIIYFTRIGDEPERIFASALDLRAPISEGVIQTAKEVLRPELSWEGATISVKPSMRGESKQEENALRDPGILTVGDKTYLFYAGAGERAIGIAQLDYY